MVDHKWHALVQDIRTAHPFRHTQLLLRSAVAGLAAAEPFRCLTALLPTEGLGLAPCALAGILLAAAEQVSRPLRRPP